MGLFYQQGNGRRAARRRTPAEPARQSLRLSGSPDNRLMASSRSARRKRRQAAAVRHYQLLRRKGRLPVHTRAERKRAAEERKRQREAEHGRARRIRQIAAVAVTPTAATAVITTAPPAISLHKIYGTYVAAEAASWPDGPDYPHTELAEVVQPDAFIPAVGTASTSTSYRLQPSVGVNPHPDGWERY